MANRQEEEFRLQMFTCTSACNPQQRPLQVTLHKKVNACDWLADNNLRRRFPAGTSVITFCIVIVACRIVSDPNELCCFRDVVFA
jgi:hypothetical protein